MENAEQMQKDEEPSLVENNVANEPEDRAPTLFSEDENLDTFKDENKSLNQDFSDTLIDDDQNEEEDLEIPAFLRKQKN